MLLLRVLHGLRLGARSLCLQGGHGLAGFKRVVIVVVGLLGLLEIINAKLIVNLQLLPNRTQKKCRNLVFHTLTRFFAKSQRAMQEVSATHGRAGRFPQTTGTAHIRCGFEEKDLYFRSWENF